MKARTIEITTEGVTKAITEATIKTETEAVTKVATKAVVMARATTIFLIPLLLCGCVGMNSKFDCNVSSGGECAPMHSIHRMADQGMFHDAGNDTNHKHKLIQNSGLGKINTPHGCHGYPLDGFAGKPIRSAESIQQIWIGPYEDANGNYHEPSYLYTVVKKGKWLSEEKEVIQD
jgi:conjugal transfer pilus assembly protein TraV